MVISFTWHVSVTHWRTINKRLATASIIFKCFSYLSIIKLTYIIMMDPLAICDVITRRALKILYFQMITYHSTWCCYRLINVPTNIKCVAQWLLNRNQFPVPPINLRSYRLEHGLWINKKQKWKNKLSEEFQPVNCTLITYRVSGNLVHLLSGIIINLCLTPYYYVFYLCSFNMK